MKFLISPFYLSMFFFAYSLPAVATPVQERLSAIRSVALRCAIQPFRYVQGNRLVKGSIRSICPDLVVLGPVARFHFPAGVLQIVLRDSANSDGGDLNIATLVDERGRETVLADGVLAFGDPIYAILGTDASRLPRIWD